MKRELFEKIGKNLHVQGKWKMQGAHFYILGIWESRD